MPQKEQNTPALRFSEFKGLWKKEKLKEVAEFVNDKVSLEKIAIDNYISTENILSDFGGIIKASKLPSVSTVTKFKKNDTLISNIRPYLKKAWLSDRDGGASNDVIVVRSKQKISGALLSFMLRNDFFIEYVMAGAKGVKMPRGDLSQIKLYPVVYPVDKNEQQKIAAFLGAADEKIAGLQKKKDLLEEYKKGCMQQLFSQQIRFTDDKGKPFPDWKKVKLKKYAKIYDGTHQTPKYVSEGVPFYSVEHVTANNFEKTKYIAEDIFAKECKRVKIERNDILLTRIGNIGSCRLVDWDVRASFYVSLALLKLSSGFLPMFANQFIKSDFFQRELWHRTIHVAFPQKINLGEIGECSIKLPCVEEQQKIGAFLSAIDDKISSVSEELDNAKIFKKGLLQQMFV